MPFIALKDVFRVKIQPGHPIGASSQRENLAARTHLRHLPSARRKWVVNPRWIMSDQFHNIKRIIKMVKYNNLLSLINGKQGYNCNQITDHS